VKKAISNIVLEEKDTAKNGASIEKSENAKTWRASTLSLDFT